MSAVYRCDAEDDSRKMTKLIMRHDMRAAPFGAPHAELYKAALDQSAWAEGVGFDVVATHEHHCDDGYIPSPLIFASAVAGRTSRIRIQVLVALLPLYDPIRMAEDMAVLDLLSEGRADVVLAVGYRHYEYALFGVDFDARGQLMDESVEVIKKAWSGEPFEYRGQTVQISPRPYRQPRPPIYFGGNSKAAARRAAREGDGFLPPVDAGLIDYYREQCRRYGKPPGEVPGGGQNANVVFVTEDPEKDWELVGPYCLYHHNAYGAFAQEALTQSKVAQEFPYARLASTREELEERKTYVIRTPEECVQMARGSGSLTFQPLAGGLPPELAWKSLKLVETKVLPELGR